MAGRKVAIAAVAGLALAAFFATDGLVRGVWAMADRGISLGWEWRAKRALTQRVALRIDSVEKESGGLFGIGKSPSLGGSLPDPMRVRASAIAVDRSGPVPAGSALEFRIPKMALQGVAKGDLVAIGIIGNAAVCLTRAPSDVAEPDLAGWLPDAPCE
jgi:hypothetical protein